MKDLSDWLTYIESLHPSEIELGLDRIRSVAERLDILNQNSKVILVAGTNGKGSCCAMLESISLTQGKSVGCYTSPHLVEFNERIRLNGVNINDELLVEAFENIENRKGDIQLTFFEFTTLAALSVFKEASPDLIVLEIGLGGRKDACNIVEPDTSVITTIDKDHTDWLGDSLEGIAFEKAGVIRNNKPAIIGDEKSFRLVSKVLDFDNDKLSLISRQDEEFRKLIDDIEINPRQLLAQNMLLAKEAFENAFNLSVELEEFASALQNIRLNGRFQQLGNQHIILDVAHNPQSAANLLTQLENYKSKYDIQHVTAVCGMMADKAITEVLSILDSGVDSWYFAELNFPRAISPTELLNEYKKVNETKKSEVCLNIGETISAFVNASAKNDLLLVFGSFITVGNTVQYYKEIAATNT